MSCNMICEHNAWGASPKCLKPELLKCPLDEVQEAKADSGKLEIDLVPMQIVRDVAEVRMYGTKKYKDPNNWRKVELRRYVNALLRHTLAFAEDINSVDDESGIPHYKHMECNLAFISELMRQEEQEECVPKRSEDTLLRDVLRGGGTYGRVRGKTAEAKGK